MAVSLLLLKIRGDGLDFWYWDNMGQPDGTGFINFMYYDTISIFKTFHKDFGSRIVHSFRVQNATSIDEQSLNKFEVYPTQTNGTSPYKIDSKQ